MNLTHLLILLLILYIANRHIDSKYIIVIFVGIAIYYYINIENFDITSTDVTYVATVICSKCSNIIYIPDGSCAAGGTHTPLVKSPSDIGTINSAHYIDKTSGDIPGTQKGWGLCVKCKCIAFKNYDKAQKCISGVHQYDNYDYSINMTIPTISQNNVKWRQDYKWCNKCGVLHHSNPGIKQICFADGGVHDSTGSSNYALWHAVVSNIVWEKLGKEQGQEMLRYINVIPSINPTPPGAGIATSTTPISRNGNLPILATDCVKCGSLVENPEGRCPKGGRHLSSQKIYSICQFWGTCSYAGQVEWSICTKCRTIIYTGGGASMSCVDNTKHTADDIKLVISTASMVDINKQSPGANRSWVGGYNWCTKCSNICNSPGTCFGGGNHDLNNTMYVLNEVTNDTATIRQYAALQSWAQAPAAPIVPVPTPTQVITPSTQVASISPTDLPLVTVTCSKCLCLTHNPDGACPAGGTHQPFIKTQNTPLTHFIIKTNGEMPNTQKGWGACMKCKCIAFKNYDKAQKCITGNHQYDNNDYNIHHNYMPNSDSKTTWGQNYKWCNKCGVLHQPITPNVAAINLVKSTCYADGGVHDSTESGNYALMNSIISVADMQNFTREQGAWVREYLDVDSPMSAPIVPTIPTMPINYNTVPISDNKTAPDPINIPQQPIITPARKYGTEASNVSSIIADSIKASNSLCVGKLCISDDMFRRIVENSINGNIYLK